MTVRSMKSRINAGLDPAQQSPLHSVLHTFNGHGFLAHGTHGRFDVFYRIAQ
ncbi:hypothetical protein LMG28727_07493 [Paraburkholderia kirstenboschensis]|nr:hypothetical protein LMG28727_07493 [Paraburkholderia kirstenboschensis]